jgi:hypothetical protein
MVQRLLRDARIAQPHGADRLVSRAVDVVGGLRAGYLGGVDVQEAGHLLECRRDGRPRAARGRRVAVRDGDPAALARTIKRAATEPGLWQRLAGAVPTPPARAEMINGFRRIYRTQGNGAEAAAIDSGRGHENTPSPALGAHEKVPIARRARTRQRSTQRVTSQEAVS